MMLRTSSNSMNPVFSLFGFTVRKNIPLMLLISFAMLLICPGYILIRLNDGGYDYTGVSDSMSSSVDGTMCVVMVLSVLICLICNFLDFSFLYSRQSSDLFHAVPMTRRELLTSRFSASVVLSAIPTSLCYISLLIMTFMPEISTSPIRILTFFVLNFLILLMLGSFSLIFIVCAGTPFDLVLSFLGINIGIPIIYYIIEMFANSLLIGYCSGSMYSMLKISPFIFAGYGMNDFLITKSSFSVSTLFFAIKLLLMTVLFLIAAILLYKRRKSERSGESYAYAFLYVICSLIVSIVAGTGIGLIFSSGGINIRFWIFAAIGALLAAIFFGAMSDRGFKRVKRSLVIGGSSYAVLIVISLCFLTGGFGYKTRVPESDKVKSAVVSFDEITADVTDSESVIALHNDIMKNSNKILSRPSYTYNGTAVLLSIDYNLSGGKTMRRQYTVELDYFLDRLLTIYKTGGTVDHIASELKNKSLIDISVSSINSNGEYVESADTLTDEESPDKYLVSKVSKSDFDKLLEAYRSDISGATADSLKNTNVDIYSITATDYDGGKYVFVEMIVESKFKNTKKAFDDILAKYQTGY